MPATKPSIPSAVASIVEHNSFIYEAIKHKIVNYHALAALLRPDVERISGKNASINTIVVALIRLAESVKNEGPSSPPLVLREARITLSSDVVDVTIETGKFEMLEFAKRLLEISPDLNEPVYLFQLSKSLKLVADEGEYNSKISRILNKVSIIRETAQLSRLDIHLSPAVETTPEFALFLTELLYRNGIRIRHTYIGEDTVLVLGRDEAIKAYEVLRQEIDRSRLS